MFVKTRINNRQEDYVKKYAEKKRRYELFLQQWAESGERYNEVANSTAKIYKQIYEDEIELFFGDELVRWEYLRSAEELKAIREYTANNSIAINGYLRGKNIMGTDKENTQRQITLISSAIADFNLERNILVYRIEDEEINNGERFILKGFTSTSINRRILAINYDDCVQYQIEVPSGKGRGAYISNQSKYKNEYEFLLQRDTKVKVIRKQSNGEFTMVRLRVVD